VLWGYFGAKLHDFAENLPNIGEKMYNHFIFTGFSNPCESSYAKCHRVSFLLSHTRFVCSIGNFGAKTADFFYENL
jgi:hypothetical protein